MRHSGSSAVHSSRARTRRSDLRFAGVISAGMIATVLTLGVLLAPLLAWNGGAAHSARDAGQTLRLTAPAAASAKAVAPATSFASDGPGHSAAAAIRQALRLGDAGGAAGAVVRMGGTTILVFDRVVETPSRTAPLAFESADSDGDGLPDT